MATPHRLAWPPRRNLAAEQPEIRRRIPVTSLSLFGELHVLRSPVPPLHRAGAAPPGPRSALPPNPVRAADAFPRVGEMAKDFQLSSVLGKPTRLSDKLAAGPVVLVVLRGYPGYQCPACRKQVQELIQSARKLESARAQVILCLSGPLGWPGGQGEGSSWDEERSPATFHAPARSGLCVHEGVRAPLERGGRDCLSRDLRPEAEDGRNRLCQNRQGTRRPRPHRRRPRSPQAADRAANDSRVPPRPHRAQVPDSSVRRSGKCRSIRSRSPSGASRRDTTGASAADVITLHRRRGVHERRNRRPIDVRALRGNDGSRAGDAVILRPFPEQSSDHYGSARQAQLHQRARRRVIRGKRADRPVSRSSPGGHVFQSDEDESGAFIGRACPPGGQDSSSEVPRLRSGIQIGRIAVLTTRLRRASNVRRPRAHGVASPRNASLCRSGRAGTATASAERRPGDSAGREDGSGGRPARSRSRATEGQRGSAAAPSSTSPSVCNSPGRHASPIPAWPRSGSAISWCDRRIVGLGSVRRRAGR